MTASQWRQVNSEAQGNISDNATAVELLVLASLEVSNAELLEQGLDKEERIRKLNEKAHDRMLLVWETAPVFVKLLATRSAYDEKLNEIEHRRRIQAEEKLIRREQELKKKIEMFLSFYPINVPHFSSVNVAPQRSDILLIAHVRIQIKTDLISLKDAIDTTTPQGKLTFQLFVALAEFEKDINRESILTLRHLSGKMTSLLLSTPEGIKIV